MCVHYFGRVAVVPALKLRETTCRHAQRIKVVIEGSIHVCGGFAWFDPSGIPFGALTHDRSVTASELLLPMAALL